MINVTLLLMMSHGDGDRGGGNSSLIPFLHLGPMGIYSKEVNNVPDAVAYIPEILRRSNVTFDNDTIVNWHAGACFAVRKERILEKGLPPQSLPRTPRFSDRKYDTELSRGCENAIKIFNRHINRKQKYSGVKI
jgi:hypothetical protein